MTYIIINIYASNLSNNPTSYATPRLIVNIFVLAYGRESAQRVSRNKR